MLPCMLTTATLMIITPRAAGVQLISATDLQTRLAVARLHDIINATWGLLGGEGLFVPLITAYLFW